MMRSCVIYNPNSGSALSHDELVALCAPLGEVELMPTSEQGGAQALAAEALTKGFELVIAAGGDGTINEVVNGLAKDWSRAQLGILPLGTGNDFARTIAMPTEPAEAVRVLAAAQSEIIDVVKVTSMDELCYFINVSAGGFSGLVDEKLDDETKKSWGPLAYLRAAVIALPDMTNYHMTFSFDDDEPLLLQALNIVVANGRFVAGGWPIAPHAVLDDGLMDVVIVPVLPATKLGLLAPQLFTGQHIDNDELVVRRARRFSVDSEPGMWFNVDGEMVGNEPAVFEVLPRTLRVIVGPDYQRIPPAD